MDPQVSRLQQAPEFFALLKLPPVFALTDAQINAAASSVGAVLDAAAPSADASTQAAIAEVRLRVDAATAALLDPIKRAECILKIFGSANDPGSLPSGFREELEALQQATSSAVAARDDERLVLVREKLIESRQTHIGRVAEVFSFPRNVPNPVSQVARDAAIRSELNAVRKLDQMLLEI